MITNLCFGLTCLLIPILIELFKLQAGLNLSDAGHSFAEIFIFCAFCWLVVQILRLDKQIYLWNLSQQGPQPQTAARKIVNKMKNVPLESPNPEQPKEPDFHGARPLFGTLFKNHRTVKSL